MEDNKFKWNREINILPEIKIISAIDAAEKN